MKKNQEGSRPELIRAIGREVKVISAKSMLIQTLLKSSLFVILLDPYLLIFLVFQETKRYYLPKDVFFLLNQTFHIHQKYQYR